MKKTVCLILALFTTLLFAGCDGGTDPLPDPDTPSNPSDPSDPSGPSNPAKPTPGGDEQNEEGYSVTLVVEGKKYVPNVEMSAVWSGKNGSKYTAAFDSNGNAVLKEEVTGTFDVTLTALPPGFAYNPNIYTATESAKKVTIELVNCFSVASVGSTPSVIGAATLSVGNVYRATFQSADDIVWFLLDPCDFETWCSVAEDKVSPKLTGYAGNAASGFYNPESAQEIVGGGPSGSFTKNISFQWNEGSMNFYVMRADSEKYPADIYFKLSPPSGGTGGDGDHGGTAKVGDTSLLKKIQPEGTFRYAYADTGRVLLADRFKLFPRGTTDSAGNEGDDYWHFYDAATDTYGATLFAMISQNCDILDTPLIGSMIRPYAYGKDYKQFLLDYAAYCNDDGAHPLTEELRVFLQGYAIQERYFNDGNGWAEMNRLQSSEENQWLFCVGYYKT